ncbi:hypothetical protein [Caulobacter sp. Root487D2Y]|uniref:hypothetical protein n=1 Tax=Caulobacter sp. Root487D2Y TaxID=1736547 RepID=UPI00138F8BDC|nr:hypothetical protein [Caulobacter sp. Root487D2Y]
MFQIWKKFSRALVAIRSPCDAPLTKALAQIFSALCVGAFVHAAITLATGFSNIPAHYQDEMARISQPRPCLDASYGGRVIAETSENCINFQGRTHNRRRPASTALENHGHGALTKV